MISKQYTWPKGEEIVYLRPPREEYNGMLDCYYSPEAFPELSPLKENWERIRNEILEIEKKEGFIKGMNSISPAKIEGEGRWSLVYLMSFRWKFHNNIKKFPVTWSVIQQIPNCVFAGISILPPHTEIKPHYGDTNAIVRTHLGLIVPEPYPVIGINVKGENRGWEDGELLCFINVQQHHVWNNSSKRRYVLMFDFIPQPLIHRTDEICSTALGSQSFIFFYKHTRLVKHLPTFIHSMMCKTFSVFWRIYLPIQRRLEFL